MFVPNGNGKNSPHCVRFDEIGSKKRMSSENLKLFGKTAVSFDRENNVSNEMAIPYFCKPTNEKLITMDDVTSVVSNHPMSSSECLTDKLMQTCEGEPAHLVKEQYELPPQNIVQDRIKVFEKPVENTSDGKSMPKTSTPSIMSSSEKTLEMSSLSSSSSSSLPLILGSSGDHRPGPDIRDGQSSMVVAGENPPSSRIREENIFTDSSVSNLTTKPATSIKFTRDFLLDVDWGISDIETNNIASVSGLNSEVKPGDNTNADFHDATNSKDKCCSEMRPLACASINEESVKVEGKEAAEGGQGCLSDEDHYLPMAPCKKSVINTTGDLFYHTRSNSASSASQIMILETLLSEDIENSYVEMTVGDEKSYLSSGLQKAKNDIDRVDSKQDSEKSHYEQLYKASSSTEPLYMEVMSKDKSASDDQAVDEFEKSERSVGGGSVGVILPDILNTPSTLKQLTDGSDADDEASKEFDPLDIPQHPRFSLSDTFRPASYYLGSGISDCTPLGLSFDQPDSSDSDLVSPPPIPTSPLPLDDFTQSLDMSETKNDVDIENVQSENDLIDNYSSPRHSSCKIQVRIYHFIRIPIR